MISLMLTVCVCVFFNIGIEAFFYTRPPYSTRRAEATEWCPYPPCFTYPSMVPPAFQTIPRWNQNRNAAATPPHFPWWPIPRNREAARACWGKKDGAICFDG